MTDDHPDAHSHVRAETSDARVSGDTPPLGSPPAAALTTATASAELERGLRDALAPAHAALAPHLAQALTQAVTEPDRAAEFVGAPALRPALRALAGREVVSNQTLISFGAGNQFGNVSIGDVAGRDIIKITIALTPSKLTPQQLRNRRAMIQKVHTIWIAGLLDRSLAETAHIDLGLSQTSEAVWQPLNIQVQELSQPPRDLPPGTVVSEVFDQCGQALLILGAPGAGKTTLLLELARDLLERANADETAPIPVVFNLASWAKQRLALDKWLVEELNTIYDIPRRIAREWVEQDALLPLLDGLDEVPWDQRDTCVEAINAFRASHQTSLAVCSRSADYDALNERLKLQGAVLIQPLTDQQVAGYLDAAGDQLTGLNMAVAQDSDLLELARTPLMLSVMSLAYRGRTTVSLIGTENTDTLWRAYCESMLRRRSTSRHFAPAQIIEYLSRIARQMGQEQRTMFFIEDLQPSWLPARLQPWFPVLAGLCIAILFGLLIAPINPVLGVLWSIGALTATFLAVDLRREPRAIWNWHRRLRWGMIIGSGYSLYYLSNFLLDTDYSVLWTVFLFVCFGSILTFIFGLTTVLLIGLADRLATLLTSLLSTQTEAPSGLRVGLIVGMGGVGMGGVVLALEGLSQISSILMAILSLGVSTGLLVYTLGVVHTVESLRWSWRPGLIVGLASAVMTLSVGLDDAVRVGVAFGLLAGLTGKTVIESRTSPNGGIQRSIRNGLVGVVVGSVAWVLLSLVHRFLYPEIEISAEEIAQVAVIMALVWAVRGGLASALQHGLLRVLVAVTGVLPFRLMRLLEEGTDRIFLRRVGGSYMFVHRLFQEWLVSQRSVHTEDKTSGA